MGVATVWTTKAEWGLDRTGARILAGVIWTVAALAVQGSLERRPEHIRAWCVPPATVAGLASVLLTPSGIGEVPIFLAASRIPFAFPMRTARWFIALTTLATAVCVGYAAHSIAGALAGVGVPFLAQRSVDRRALIEQRDRAEAMVVEVEAGRDAEAQAAALRERAHIAREMHDVLAHSLAGLSLQLQATRALAQKSGGDPRLLTAIDQAADLARDGLAEARVAVGTLQAPALRGVGDLEELLRTHPGRIAYAADGAPAALGAEAGHAVYRAVQESLTNAARYAPGSVVRVRLAWSPGRLSVAIADDGAAPGHAPLTGQGTGLGLTGMRERLAAVGGEVTAGPAGSGWQVRLTVPTVPAVSAEVTR
jgi:signal transduction histidine kinase